MGFAVMSLKLFMYLLHASPYARIPCYRILAVGQISATQYAWNARYGDARINYILLVFVEYTAHTTHTF